MLSFSGLPSNWRRLIFLLSWVDQLLQFFPGFPSRFPVASQHACCLSRFSFPLGTLASRVESSRQHHHDQLTARPTGQARHGRASEPTVQLPDVPSQAQLILLKRFSPFSQKPETKLKLRITCFRFQFRKLPKIDFIKSVLCLVLIM